MSLRTPAAPRAVPPRPGRRVMAWRWAGVALWMGLIFWLSSDPDSGANSSRLLGPVIRFFAPGLPEETMWRIIFVCRKAAHFVAFGTLAWLLWRALERPGDAGRWRWSRAGWALALTVLYAMSDEWHQGWVPPRQPSAWDVALDTAGAASALAATWGWGRWRRRW